jgi:UDP-N-acetylmuramoyl-tripeptide--D-alanyl-D-alanine ligase
MTAPLWTAAEVAKATQGIGSQNFHASGVSIDSRTIEPGDLFLAIKGPNQDGHDYLPQVAARKAAAAIVRRGAIVPAGLPFLEVEDTRQALYALGQAARARSTARIAAVTGSVGKTSAKEMLRLVLAEQGSCHGSAGNLNNEWGLPLSLARMPAASRFAVFEIGMNHAGEIRPLSRLARPHVAIVTTVEAVHLEFFNSVAEIADAKAEIFEGIEPGGAAVLNRDNPWYDRLVETAKRQGVARIVGFGKNPAADARLLSTAAAAAGMDVQAALFGARIDYRIGATGQHWAMNSLAVLAAAKLLGADLEAAARALAGATALPGRGAQRSLPIAGGSLLLIDDSYNASPVSVAAALDVLASLKPGSGGRRIAVLGDMLELGPNAESLHAGLAPEIAGKPIDLVFLAGSLMGKLGEVLPKKLVARHEPNTSALAPHVTAALRPGDAVLVKGSLGSKMSIIVRAIEALAIAAKAG